VRVVGAPDAHCAGFLFVGGLEDAASVENVWLRVWDLPSPVLPEIEILFGYFYYIKKLISLFGLTISFHSLLVLLSLNRFQNLLLKIVFL